MGRVHRVMRNEIQRKCVEKEYTTCKKYINSRCAVCQNGYNLESDFTCKKVLAEDVVDECVYINGVCIQCGSIGYTYDSENNVCMKKEENVRFNYRNETL